MAHKTKPSKKRFIAENKLFLQRYGIAAAATWLMQFLSDWAASSLRLSPLIPFAARLIIFFLLLKFWVYRPKSEDADIFRLLMQAMLTIMLIPIATLLINYLKIFLTALLGGALFFYFLSALMVELLYFIIFHFIIFKKN